MRQVAVSNNKVKGRKITYKMCVKCGKVLPLDRFYLHKDWAAQSYHDAWCKDCAAKCSTNREGAREYCWYNNRRWSDAYWEMAVKKAKYTLANDPDYLNAKDDAKRQEIEDRIAGRLFFSVMNLAGVYQFSSNIDTEGAFREFDPDSPAGTVTRDDTGAFLDEGELIYSKVWNGMYTQREIEYLDDYYAHLEEGFVLDNQNIQDYARKAAKASLDADIKYSKMRHGQASVAEWEKAQAIFDNLSKSANFAACKRKPGDMAGLGSLGTIVAKIEMSGELDMPRVKFPPDDIDKIIADFRHTVEAVGLDQVTV